MPTLSFPVSFGVSVKEKKAKRVRSSKFRFEIATSSSFPAITYPTSPNAFQGGRIHVGAPFSNAASSSLSIEPALIERKRSMEPRIQRKPSAAISPLSLSLTFNESQPSRIETLALKACYLNSCSSLQPEIEGKVYCQKSTTS